MEVEGVYLKCHSCEGRNPKYLAPQFYCAGFDCHSQRSEESIKKRHCERGTAERGNLPYHLPPRFTRLFTKYAIHNSKLNA